MFASTVLAARIELAEAKLTRALAAGVQEPHPLIRDFAGGISAVTRPGSPLNKIIGVGFDGAFDERALAAVEADWRERQEPARIELATLADPAIAPLLTARGYRLQGFENVLGLALAGRAENPATSVTVEAVRSGEDSSWLETVIAGFAVPDGTGVTSEVIAREALAPIMEDFRRASGLVRSLARIEGVPVGAASLRLDAGVAQLCGATTLPRFRRRGVQRALLEARLGLAAASGCDVAIMTTSPGTQSQANAHNHGFALLYARAILVRAWT
jgi:GNAT superfamily N-acetyltransferase